MSRAYTSVVTFAAACCLSAALGCSVATPLTPEPPAGSTTATNADGSTLKAGAPTLVSPINSDIITTQKPTLTISRAIGEFSNSTQFAYEFELQNDTGTVLVRASSTGTSFTVPDNLVINAAFRWRARATLNGAVGPYSALGRFQTPRLQIPTASSSNDEWKNWFFQIVDLRGVGPIMTVQALITLDPDFREANVIQETNSAGQPRGRIYLPTGNPNNLYGRSVDLGTFGQPWRWEPRGGTTCEGGSCR
jgi:hypothetical protein